MALSCQHPGPFQGSLLSYSSSLVPTFVSKLNPIFQFNMIRQSITRPLVSANRALCQRSFSVAVPRLGEGDTGAPRTGGAAAGYVERYIPTHLGFHSLAAAWLSSLTAYLAFYR